MKNFFYRLVADTNGVPDEQALIAIIGAAVFFGLEIYSVTVLKRSFDAFGFGAGIGALLGATSAGFGLRARWSPANNSEDSTTDPVTGRFIGGFNARNPD